MVAKSGRSQGVSGPTPARLDLVAGSGAPRGIRTLVPALTKSVRLETREARRKLAQAHEVYWRSVERGVVVGYRKSAEGALGTSGARLWCLAPATPRLEQARSRQKNHRQIEYGHRRLRVEFQYRGRAQHSQRIQRAWSTQNWKPEHRSRHVHCPCEREQRQYGNWIPRTYWRL